MDYMTTSDPKFEELRDIILWQQLNKQLIGLRDNGAQISEQDQKKLQHFCFENSLFRELTKDPLIDEIPLVIVTDFYGKNIVTFGNDCWTSCLNALLPKTIVLDVELAMSQTFDELGKYGKKYFTKEPDSSRDDTDDDDELYEVIDQYNALIEEQGRDLPKILNELFEIKGSVLSRLMDNYDAINFIMQDGSVIGFDFQQSPHRNTIASLYNDEFCVKAMEIISHLTAATVALKKMDLDIFFNDIQSKPALKKSISDFINHERDIQRRQSRLLNDFHKKVLTRHHARDLYMISACETSPFAFLAEPFPVV